MKEEQDNIDVRSIVTADAPYAGNVMRIPQEIQQKARQLCWKYNMTDPSDGMAQATILRELLGSWSVWQLCHTSTSTMASIRILRADILPLSTSIACFSTLHRYILVKMCLSVRSAYWLAPDIPSTRSNVARNRLRRASLSTSATTFGSAQASPSLVVALSLLQVQWLQRTFLQESLPAVCHAR